MQANVYRLELNFGLEGATKISLPALLGYLQSQDRARKLNQS